MTEDYKASGIKPDAFPMMKRREMHMPLYKHCSEIVSRSSIYARLNLCPKCAMVLGRKMSDFGKKLYTIRTRRVIT